LIEPVPTVAADVVGVAVVDDAVVDSNTNRDFPPAVLLDYEPEVDEDADSDINLWSMLQRIRASS